MKTHLRLFKAFGLALGLAVASQANALVASQTYNLTLNNVNLPSANYGTVMLANDGNGGVQFTVTPSSALNAASNFGIQKFVFNVDLAGLISANGLGSLQSSDIAGAITFPDSTYAGWTASSTGASADGYGGFNVLVSNNGYDRQDPLSFDIALGSLGITNYTLSQFAVANGDNNLFATHIAGFSNTDTSGATQTGAWFASPVPLPSSVWLMGTGLLGLVGLVGRRRKAA